MISPGMEVSDLLIVPAMTAKCSDLDKTVYITDNAHSDECNFWLPLDNELTELTKNLEPHHNVFVLDRPGIVSGNIAIPKTVIATMANWIAHGSNRQYSQQQIDNFNSLPEAA